MRAKHLFCSSFFCRRVSIRRIGLLVFIALIFLAFGVAGASWGPHETIASVDPTPISRNLELVGHLGGSSRAAVHDGAYLYVATRTELAVYNTPPSGQMERLGYILLDSPSYIVDLGLWRNTAYVLQMDRLTILEITSPQSPQIVSSMPVPEHAQSLLIVNGLLYLTIATYSPEGSAVGELWILNLSQPLRPSLVMQLSITDFAPYNLAISGEILALGGGRPEGDLDASGWVRFFDISTPVKPKSLGTYFNRSGSVTQVAIQGHYAYVIIYYGGFRVVDISDPTNPQEVSDAAPRFSASSFIIHRDVLYAGYAGEPQGIAIVDLSDPAAPVEVGHFEDGFCTPLVILSSSLYYRCGFSVNGTYLAMADLTEPTAPTRIGVLPTIRLATNIAVENGLAVVDANPVALVDVSDPTNPRVTSIYTGSPEAGYLGWNASSLALAGKRLYVSGRLSPSSDGETKVGVAIVDVSEPSHPRNLGLYRARDDRVGGIVVHDGYVFLNTASTHTKTQSLRVVDVSDPTLPNETGVLTIPGNGDAGEIVLDHEILYITNATLPHYPSSYEEHWIRVIDVADPSRPILFATYRPQGEPVGLAVKDDRLYISFWDVKNKGCQRGIETVDIHNRSTPTRLWVSCLPQEQPNQARSLLIFGQYLVAASGNLYVLDTTMPWAMGEAGYDRHTYGASSVVESDGYLYLADWNTGLYIYRFRPPHVASRITGADVLTASKNISYQFGTTTFDGPIVFTHTERFANSNAFTGSLEFAGLLFENEATRPDGAPGSPHSPYTVTVFYGDSFPVTLDEASLSLYRWDESGWRREPSSRVDPETNILTAHPDKLGLWGIAGVTHRTYLPAVAHPPD